MTAWRWNNPTVDRERYEQESLDVYSELGKTLGECERLRKALQVIALGRAVNPQGYAMLVLDAEQTAQRFHRPEAKNDD